MTTSDNRDFVGGRVVDPTHGLDAIRTVAVRNGVIAALRDDAPSSPDATVDRVDCAGMVLCPGFIDPHVHLREPGDPHKETLASGLARGRCRRIHRGRCDAEHASRDATTPAAFSVCALPPVAPAACAAIRSER